MKCVLSVEELKSVGIDLTSEQLVKMGIERLICDRFPVESCECENVR
jgi:hypothetical protein